MSCKQLKQLGQITGINKNSSGNEIANVNFTQYAQKVPEFTEITQNNRHYAIQGHRFWYQSKAHIRFPISD